MDKGSGYLSLQRHPRVTISEEERKSCECKFRERWKAQDVLLSRLSFAGIKCPLAPQLSFYLPIDKSSVVLCNIVSLNSVKDYKYTNKRRHFSNKDTS